MTSEKEERALQVKVCRSFFAAGLTLFNPNAFTLDKAAVEAVAYRLALVLHSNHHLKRTVDSERAHFLAHIRDTWEGYSSAACSQKGGVLAYADGVEYMAEFHQVLIQLKSFLDVFARITCRIFKPADPPVNGFGEAAVDGERLSGGKLVRWLRRSSGLTPEQEKVIAEPIIRHSREWITSAIHHRDTLLHYGAIDGFEHMQVFIGPSTEDVTLEDIALPEMPGGETILVYSAALIHNIGAFVEELLSALPVKHDLIGSWDAARQELGGA